MVQHRIIFNSPGFLRDNEFFGWLGLENHYFFRTISYLEAFNYFFLLISAYGIVR